MDVNEILFRASSNGHLMVEPREKSPFKKWEEEAVKLYDWETQYAEFDEKKQRQKSGVKLLARIEQKRILVNELLKHRYDTHLAEGVITHLIDIYASYKYDRREEVHSKYTEKGNRREERAITTVSRANGIIYKKNSERLSNGFVQGEVDFYEGESITTAEITHDTKCPWSMHTLLRAKHKELDKLYKWQGVTYMWLTGAKQHHVHFCLENGTFEAIEAEKNKLRYVYEMYDSFGNPSDKCLELLKQIEVNHIFDLQQFRMEHPHYDFANDINEWKWDVPLRERIHTKIVNRDDEEIERLKKRIVECRKWMSENLFSNPLVMLAEHDPEVNATIIKET